MVSLNLFERIIKYTNFFQDRTSSNSFLPQNDKNLNDRDLFKFTIHVNLFDLLILLNIFIYLVYYYKNGIVSFILYVCRYNGENSTLNSSKNTSRIKKESSDSYATKSTINDNKQIIKNNRKVSNYRFSKAFGRIYIIKSRSYCIHNC